MDDNNPMRNVLMVVYYFPPTGGGGVLRAQKFAKYLPRYGWLPTVVAADIPFCSKDETLLKELDERIEIFRTKAPGRFNVENRLSKRTKKDKINLSLKLWKRTKANILKFLLIPDEFVMWVPFAYKASKNLIKSRRINVIYSSAPPFSAYLVGYLLKKRTGLPWILDYRDLWLNHIIFRPKSKWSYFVCSKLERRFIQSADKVITASPVITEDLIRRYKDKSKFITITNGYDSEIFNSISDKSYKVRDKFTIIYAGSLSDYQTPEYFIKAIKALISENPEITSNIEIIFAGGVEKSYQERFFIPGVTKFLGAVSYIEAAKLMCSSDILLLIIYEAGCSSSIFTTKVFDYIGARRPILGLIPEGVAAELIRREKLGVVVSSKDISAIKDAIFGFYRRWEEKKLYTEADYDKLSQEFGRANLTYKLSEKLKEALVNK